MDYQASDLVFEIPNVSAVLRKAEKRPSKERECHEKKGVLTRVVHVLITN